jgi:hypothetical protein
MRCVGAADRYVLGLFLVILAIIVLAAYYTQKNKQ